MALMRLDKLLAGRTSHSRSEVRQLLREGAVRVDGVCITDGSRKIDPETQTVSCGGKILPGGKYTYYILNKPKGVVSATEDRQYTVLDLIPAEQRVKGLFPAGRLDADSTGLLLLTDDGALAHRMLAPGKHVPKFYLIRLARPFAEHYVARLQEGSRLADGTVCLPAEVQHLRERYALICLHEGKYHQVKRMFAALGNHVESLHRVGIGGYLLPPGLESGCYLSISHKDVENLLSEGCLEVVCEQIMKNFSSYLLNADQEV